MRPTFGVRTLDFCTSLLGLPLLLPRTPVPAALRTRPGGRHPSPAPVRAAPGGASTGAGVSRHLEGGPERADPGRELRTRLVREYGRRLGLVAAALEPLDDSWARDAVRHARRIGCALAAWDAHLGGAGPGEEAAPEPPHDLHALGAEVRSLVARASARLGGARGGARPPEG